MLPFLKRQGNNVVLREEAKPDPGAPRWARVVVRAHAIVQKADSRPETWRRALSKLTNGGKDMQVALINIMHGNAYRPQIVDLEGNPTGQVTDLIIPTAEVRRAAAMNLHEMLHGKAVVETEVRVAEAEASTRLQLESMSDAELERFIEGEYQELAEGAPLANPQTVE